MQKDRFVYFSPPVIARSLGDKGNKRPKECQNSDLLVVIKVLHDLTPVGCKIKVYMSNRPKLMKGGDEMYCMISVNQVKPGKLEALTKFLEKDFVPLLKKSPGFRGAYAVAGPKGEYTGFMLWNSRSEAEAYAKSPGRKKLLEAAAEFYEGAMKPQYGEVIIAATA